MHGSAQVSDPLAMDDPHLKDAPFLASSQIFRNEMLYLTRIEVVQIEHTINRKLNGFVHRNGKDLLLPGCFLRYTIKITIRQADLADTATVADFNVRLALETENLRLDPECVATGVAAVLRDTAKGVYYVAEVDGKIAGQVMITYEWSDWRNGNLWWLQSVYVKPELRRAGVFRALFAHLQELARNSKDVCGLRLYMHGDNLRARNSYERLGMRPTKYEVFQMEL